MFTKSLFMLPPLYKETKKVTKIGVNKIKRKHLEAKTNKGKILGKECLRLTASSL